MKKLRRYVEAGIEHWEHEGRGKRGFRKLKGAFAVQWIKKLQDNYGEYQPTNRKKIELPPDTKANLFVSYVVDMELESIQTVSFHYFPKDLEPRLSSTYSSQELSSGKRWNMSS